MTLALGNCCGERKCLVTISNEHGMIFLSKFSIDHNNITLKNMVFTEEGCFFLYFCAIQNGGSIRSRSN